MLSPPVSVQLTPAQLAWLDAKRQHGAISRSAALRQALDDLMAAKPAEPPQRHTKP
jgi:Arc/MetJ-type ribon-helix-helix transcriptional regulator